MKKYMSSLVLVTVLSLAVVFNAGCESDAQTGALIGTGVGAGAGAVIGHQSGHTTEGALIGGAAGAIGGYLIGNEGDKKKEQQRTQAAATYSAPPQASYTAPAESYVTVPITNSNGSIIEVKLKKQGAVYIGPKGETYPQLPTSEQLKPIYGF